MPPAIGLTKKRGLREFGGKHPRKRHKGWIPFQELFPTGEARGGRMEAKDAMEEEEADPSSPTLEG